MNLIGFAIPARTAPWVLSQILAHKRVRVGNFILALNGQAVQYVDDLHRGLSESPFGESVRLELLRKTRRMVLEVTPEEMQRREN